MPEYVLRYSKVHIELGHHQGPLEELQVGPPGTVNLKQLRDWITVMALNGNVDFKSCSALLSKYDSCLENTVSAKKKCAYHGIS